MKPIPLSAPHVGETERAALLEAFDSGWIAPAGPQLDAFDEDLIHYTGAPAAIAVSSGSAALHLCLLLHGVSHGDEVVVQSATFAASAFAVAQCGATSVFCDSDSDSWCMDAEVLGNFLDERSKTGRLPKAVMPVDLYGSIADYDKLATLCAEYGVALIRDAAESLGSIGESDLTGHLAAVSFNGNKIITASAGGALLGTAAQVQRARYLSTQAREPVMHYEHTSVGFNYRLSNLLAAVGRAQLSQIESRINRRRQIFERYNETLSEFEWCPFEKTHRPNHWLSVGLMPDGNPLEICDQLHKLGIQARPAWKPMHQQPVFANSEYLHGQGVADDLFSRGLCLPSGSSMTDLDVERVIEAVQLVRKGM